jgi:dienelactone hydrolase
MAERLDIEFRSGGERCSAWLYLAGDGVEAPGPAIVMAHGLGAIREMRLDAFAERFAAAGYACLVFDYRHFGASDGEPRQLLDVGKQLEDWKAALAYARARDEVDAGRVVLWGTSFSGGHVIATAADDQDVAAVISQCPFTDGLASIAAMNPRSAAKVTARAIRDVVSAVRGRRPVMVDTVGSAGEPALMTAPDCVPGYLGIVPEGAPFRNEVAGRIGITVVPYRPGTKAARVACPILFCICERDSVAPAGATHHHARKAPRGEIHGYPYGHFEVYTGEPFEHVVGDQLAFLDRHVSAESTAVATLAQR